jgi:hypothetical protein
MVGGNVMTFILELQLTIEYNIIQLIKVIRLHVSYIICY